MKKIKHLVADSQKIIFATLTEVPAAQRLRLLYRVKIIGENSFPKNYILFNNHK